MQIILQLLFLERWWLILAKKTGAKVAAGSSLTQVRTNRDTSTGRFAGCKGVTTEETRAARRKSLTIDAFKSTYENHNKK